MRRRTKGAIREMLRNLGAASRQEPGCVNYVTHYVESEPNTVVIYEQYRDVDALEAHRGSQHFDEYAHQRSLPQSARAYGRNAH